MKKNTIKAFTLVEMLIVIVIIGILIAALMPRMQSAQGRARDVARKNDLAQIATAMVTSQQDKGEWPGMADDSGLDPTGAISVGEEKIKDLLLAAGMSSVPQDPLSSTVVKGLGDGESEAGQYLYMVTTRNGTENGGFILMAKTEIEGGSNYAICDGESISAGTDLKEIHPCNKLSQDEGGSCDVSDPDNCKYTEQGDLRYIYMY